MLVVKQLLMWRFNSLSICVNVKVIVYRRFTRIDQKSVIIITMKSQNSNNLRLLSSCYVLATFSHFIATAMLRRVLPCSPFYKQGDGGTEKFQSFCRRSYPRSAAERGSEPRHFIHSFTGLDSCSETGTVPGIHKTMMNT